MDGPLLEMREDLSAPGLLRAVRGAFAKVIDYRSGHTTYSLTDSLMSGLAVFGMKSPSLLQFDRMTHQKEFAQHNLKSLYGVTKAPSDTGLREILDPVSSQDLRGAFKKVFSLLQRGKALESFAFMDGHYLASVDGTGYFESKDIHCSQCCQKDCKDGSVHYYHQMLGIALVHPAQKTVFPLAPEPILKQDGAKKNDSERTAAKRLLQDVRREHPHLKLIVIEDALAANAPHLQLLKELEMRFIIGVKPGDHAYMFDYVEDAMSLGAVAAYEIVEDKVTHKFRFINDVPLNESNSNVLVNFIEYWEIKGGKTQHFSWITDFSVTNKNVYQLMRGARCRWKIENETFNTLKNQGYHFEHNFGHGDLNLSTNFAFLMFLAFLIDQAQEHCCRLFQAAKEKMGSRKALWETMRGLFMHLKFPDWDTFYRAIIFGYEINGFTVNTS